MLLANEIGTQTFQNLQISDQSTILIPCQITVAHCSDKEGPNLESLLVALFVERKVEKDIICTECKTQASVNLVCYIPLIDAFLSHAA